MTETTPAERSAAFDDALQNAGHALMLPDPVPAMARVLTAFRDEYRAELLAAATVPASAPAEQTAPPSTFVLWLDASDGSVPTHDGIVWPDGATTVHHRNSGLTATHASLELAQQFTHGKQGRIVLPASVDRSALSARLWAVAEHDIVAEWICCEPINPEHDLCVQGDATRRMVRALLVDDPDAYRPAPLLDAVLAEQTAADRAAILREAAEALGRMDYDTDSNDYGYDTYRDAWNGGVMDGADELRRLADAASGPGGAAGETQQDECACDPAPHREDDGTYSHWAGCPIADVQQAADEAQQDGPRKACACGQDGCEYCDVEDEDEADELPGPEVVAYRNSDRPGVLLCREHGDGWWGLTPLTSDDLPDGGTCTYGDPADPNDVCGRDVLIAQAAAVSQPDGEA